MLAKFENDVIKFATGKVLVNDGMITVNPKEEDFINAGYVEVVEKRLKDKEGFYQVPKYSEKDGKIIAKYEYVELPEGDLDV